MAQVNAYLTFNGNCREVMSFYKECLGGELFLQTVKDSPMADQWPAAAQDKILHACLVNGPLLLMGSDMEGQEGIPGNVISLCLNCKEEDDMETLFSKLSSGGTITRPLHEFFAGTIGMATDKFGMNWMFYSTKKSTQEVQPVDKLEAELV